MPHLSVILCTSACISFVNKLSTRQNHLSQKTQDDSISRSELKACMRSIVKQHISLGREGLIAVAGLQLTESSDHCSGTAAWIGHININAM